MASLHQSSAEPAVGLLLIDERGWILLQLRGPGGAYPDHWSTVGGAIEQGETDEAAIEREVLEETGYRLTHAYVLGSEATITLPDGRTRLAKLFYADYDRSQPIHCFEGRAMEFVDPETLDQLLVYPGQHDLILAALAHRRAGSRVK